MDLYSAEHVGLTEIEVGIPDPAEERAAVLERDARDWWTRLRRELETIPEHEPKRRRSDGLLNASERPAVESGGKDRNDLVGKGLGPGRDACSHRLPPIARELPRVVQNAGNCSAKQGDSPPRRFLAVAASRFKDCRKSGAGAVVQRRRVRPRTRPEGPASEYREAHAPAQPPPRLVESITSVFRPLTGGFVAPALSFWGLLVSGEA